MTTAACSAVHSDGVRELITLEGEKIAGATAAMKGFRTESDERVKALKKAQADLDLALKQQQASEHVHALIFSSNQNLSTASAQPSGGVASSLCAIDPRQLLLPPSRGLQAPGRRAATKRGAGQRPTF